MDARIKEIYEITKEEITNGMDVYKYIPIIYGLIKEEDYEAAEGIRLAISDLGILLKIPNTEKELDEVMNLIEKRNKL